MDAPRWVVPDFVDSPEDIPSDTTTLQEALDKAATDGLTYLYDFGDDWEHDIHVDGTQAPEPDQTYPRLVAAENTCPPEDIGGPPGFEMFKEAMQNPKHPEHRELKDWYGGTFNPHDPNVKQLQKNVAKIAKQISK